MLPQIKHKYISREFTNVMSMPMLAQLTWLNVHDYEWVSTYARMPRSRKFQLETLENHSSVRQGDCNFHHQSAALLHSCCVVSMGTVSRA